jgi:transcription elongation factor Elf1
MKAWKGPRKGPCTTGEAKTMVAIVCGAEVEEVEAFVVIATVKCENCGLPHNMVTNQNVSPRDAIDILARSLQSMIEEATG